MKHIKYIQILLVLFISFNCYSAIENLTPSQLLKAQENGVVVIDIRTPEEWSQQGTIENVSKIMFFDQKRQPLLNDFMYEFNKVVKSKDQKFVLVCRSGNRTGIVAKYLHNNLGFSKVSHLEKGMNQWILENLPIIKNN